MKNVVDKAPYFKFNYYSYNIKVFNEVFIGQIEAIDDEKTGNLTFSLEFENKSDSELFCITQSGVIYFCDPLLVDGIGFKDISLKDILSHFKRDEYRLKTLEIIF